MNKKLLDTLIEKSREIMEQDKMFHDFAHVNNILRNATYLTEVLGGDRDIIYSAVLFHDIARDMENHEANGALRARAILKEISLFPQQKIDEVCLAIERHEIGQITHNEQIVADADKIDAFNELGIARAFMMLGKRNYKLVDAVDNYLELLQKWYAQFHFDESRDLVQIEYAKSKIFLTNIKLRYA